MKLFDTFNSWDEFHAAVKTYIECTFQPFVKASSKKIETHNKACKVPYPLDMVYYYQSYQCSHRGAFKPRGAGVRETKKSVKDGCKAKIQACLHKCDPSKIVISIMNEQHSHPIVKTEMPPRPKTTKYTEEAVLAACQSVTTHKKSQRVAASLHGVPVSTLRDRLKGRKAICEVQRTVITPKDETRIVDWVKECARRGFGRTMAHVQQAVQAILNQRMAETIFKDNLPGRKWTTLFLQRHKDISIGTSQRPAVVPKKLRVWFEAAFKEITEVGGDVLDHPSRIFNCDGTGFQLGGSACSKVLAAKGGAQVNQVSNVTQPQLTVLVCASASGDVHSPLIIFPGERFSYDPLEGFPDAHFARSDNGQVNSYIFAVWLREVFIPATKHLPKPVVLFVDGHKMHLTLTVSDLCREHNIILYQLPCHSSHLVQPLDLTTFRELKQAWREAVLKFQEENRDIVGKKDFSVVFKKAWTNGIKKDVVASGFRAAGLYPWDPDHIDAGKLGLSRDRVRTLTATDSVTVTIPTTAQVPGETSHEIVTVTTAQVPGETSHETVTVTANNTPLLPPSPTALPAFSPSVDPSPTIYSSDSDLPPLSPPSVDPTSSTTHPSCLLPRPSSSSLAAVPTPSTSLTTTTTPVAPRVTSNSVTELDKLSSTQALDRLLVLTARAGIDSLVHYQTRHTLETEADDEEEDLFFQLYSRLSARLRDDGPTARIDPLRQPSQSIKKRTMLQPSRIVNSVSFDKFKSDECDKKRQEEEEKERRKQEREQWKKGKEEKERKREREEKKAEKEKELKARKRMKKRRIDEDTADSFTSKCVDKNS